MPTANPLEQLRRRMLSHASPAAFAAAAEEHRRAGRLAEAIAVCRDGLDRYPAYASARVTLGRALFDSGDVAAAVTELEQAVAQAPDNLAASRALDAARAALGDVPPPIPVVAAPVALAPLQPAAPADEDTGAFPVPWLDQGPAATAADAGPPALPGQASDPFDQALALGADGPQEFGLGPDWLPTAPVAADGPMRALPSALEALEGFEPEPPPGLDAGPLQGEEPAGIWPALSTEASPTATETAGAPVYSWTRDDQGGTALEGAAPTPSIWDAPTIEAPVREAASAFTEVVAGPLVVAPPPEGAPVAADEAADTSADPGGTGSWSGLFVEPVSEGAAPATFTGWEASGPSGRDVPTWDDAPDAEPVTSAFTVPGLWGDEPAARDDAASPAWSATETPLPPATTSPDWHVASAPIDPSAATPEAMGEWTMLVTPVAAEAPVPSVAPAPSPWEGSVASALGEVFARAGQGGAPTPGHASLEPPMHPNAAVREAMADTAVEAVLDDVAQQEQVLPPALASLQQMLDAVRARRAALHAEMNH